jgi:hypothetical protein
MAAGFCFPPLAEELAAMGRSYRGDQGTLMRRQA